RTRRPTPAPGRRSTPRADTADRRARARPGTRSIHKRGIARPPPIMRAWACASAPAAFVPLPRAAPPTVAAARARRRDRASACRSRPPFLGEQPPQRHVGAVGAQLDGAGRAAGNRRRLLVAAALHLGEDQRLALALG